MFIACMNGSEKPRCFPKPRFCVLVEPQMSSLAGQGPLPAIESFHPASAKRLKNDRSRTLRGDDCWCSSKLSSQKEPMCRLAMLMYVCGEILRLFLKKT